ncbi:hypothetical protein [Microlunatus ginsengisoli]|jgi:hypothetical protein|uniref:Uncharacterized protein n=1 Tax=Microlunatus ginsengisoli TaxID=363863 RepID=A0ABP7AZC0_9ACTN
MSEARSAIEPDLAPQLVEALAAEVAAAAEPQDRALVVDHVVEQLVSAIASDPAVGEVERQSVMPVLDAADEHCERMGAFTS